MGCNILYSKDSILCIGAVADTILAELVLEKTEEPVYARKEACIAEDAVRVI